MSIVLLLVYFFILLFLGFGFNGWVLAAMIIGLTIGLSFMMVGLDIQSVKENWSERRCELDVIMTGFLYKQDGDERSSSEFMSENFQFCIQDTVQSFLKILMTPVFAAFNVQLNLAGGVVMIMNVLRNLKAEMLNSFMKIISPMYQRFINTGMAFSQNFQRFYSAMRRVAGIAVASLYLGMSVHVLIDNFVKFVVKVVLIIMGIIAGLLVIMFFGIVPFLGMIIAVVVLLDQAGFDTLGLGPVFCFDPKTPVVLYNKTVKPIEKLNVGDQLEDGGFVEGMLRSIAANEQMYSVKGILVSGSHLVFDEEREEWLSVSEYKFAEPIFTKPESLICLRTSTRNIPLRDNHGFVHIFRDWEELPEKEGVDAFWNYLVSKLIHAKKTETPKEDPLCGIRCEVTLSTGERLPIGHVRIGDSVYSEKGFTKVLGVYEGVARFSSPKGLTDGIWIQKGGWEHPKEAKAQEKMRGYHLITQAGTFWVESDNYSGCIRDFTEVGLDQLPLTYSFTHALLKKSPSKEELCVLDSSLLVSSFYSQLIF